MTRRLSFGPRPRGVAVLVLLVAWLASPSGAAGAAGYDVPALLRLAEAGDTRAAFVLGMRFASGDETTRDDTEAVRWLTIAAEGGLAEAQYNLGILHATGRGPAPEPAQARRWYEAAAGQGLAQAQYNLGALYATGDGVARDEQRAAEWFRRAAEQDLPEAAYNLGVLLEYGRGVARDPRAAARWYGRAAELGLERARARLARLDAAEDAADASPIVPDRRETAAVAPPAGAWLARRDPADYTIQLLSHTEEGSVRRFVERRFDPDEATYFAREVDGKIWFTVVYGAYPSVSSAQAAIEGLAPELRARKPWVRKIGVLQRSAVR